MTKMRTLVYMYPKKISEVLYCLKNNELIEGPHVELKAYKNETKVDDLSKTIIGMANSGGGVIVLGVSDKDLAQSNKKKSVSRGLPSDIQNAILVLSKHIDTHVKGAIDWTVEYGNWEGVEIAALFVQPANNDVVYFFSESNPADRIYYYRNGTTTIRERYQYRTIYKYMTLDAAILSLEKKSWRFWEPLKWSDRYESRFYCADYDDLNVPKGCVRRVYATCLTKKKNSDAAWKVYAGNVGLQSHCVQFEIDVASFRDELSKYCKHGWSEKTVNYQREEYIKELHKSSAKDHDKYFRNFDFNFFLNLLALKRDAYAYENEVRFFVTKSEFESRNHIRKKAAYIDVKMDFGKIIKGIRVDNKCTDSELIALRYSCRKCGINPVFHGNRNLPDLDLEDFSNLKTIKVFLFDINNMPGRKPIRIDPRVEK